MNRYEKMQYDFPTEKNLEVAMQNGTWIRVTCDTFRSYYGPRRINSETYTGIYYYRDTNYMYTEPLLEYSYKELRRSDYKSRVGINPNMIRRDM